MKKLLVYLILFIVFGIFAGNLQAATVTWTGGGSDSYASNRFNWDGDEAPQDGDNVVFDSTDIDCIWDYSVTLASITRTNDYIGEITKKSISDEVYVNLDIAKIITWTGGAIDNNNASDPENWSLGRVPQNGDKVIFNDTSSDNALWDLPDTVPALVTVTSGYSGVITLDNAVSITGNLTVTGGTFNLNDKALNVDGYLLINAGGTINATSSTITVKGDWANVGNFNCGTSTVVLAGTDRIIYGDTIFYNLIKTVTSDETLYFEAGSTQTIINNLTLQGSADNLLSLRSTVNGSYWYINPLGSSNISFVNIKDMNNINFVNVVPLNSVDEGNNEGTNFGGSECSCIEDNRIFAKLIYGEWRVTC